MPKKAWKIDGGVDASFVSEIDRSLQISFGITADRAIASYFSEGVNILGRPHDAPAYIATYNVAPNELATRICEHLGSDAIFASENKFENRAISLTPSGKSTKCNHSSAIDRFVQKSDQILFMPSQFDAAGLSGHVHAANVAQEKVELEISKSNKESGQTRLIVVRNIGLAIMCTGIVLLALIFLNGPRPAWELWVNLYEAWVITILGAGIAMFVDSKK